MFLPKPKLANIGDKVTYINDDESIFKEDVVLNNRNNSYTRREIKSREIVLFDNEPTSGWHMSIEPSLPVRCNNPEDQVILRHPTLDVIVAIPMIFFKRIFKYATIKNGIIENKIILLSDGYYTDIDIEGSETYNKHISILELSKNVNNYINKKDLKVGNTVIFKNKYGIKECIFLGTQYAALYFYWNNTKSITVSRVIDKVHFFTKIEDCKESIFAIKDSALKEIMLLEDNETNIKFTDLFKGEEIRHDYKWLKNLKGKKAYRKSGNNLILADTKTDSVFNDLETLKKYILKADESLEINHFDKSSGLNIYSVHYIEFTKDGER